MGYVKGIYFHLLLLLISQITWSQASIPRTDSTITYSYTSLTDSLLDSKAISSYDSVGNLKLEYFYIWDQDLSDWAEASKCEYAYNSTGDLVRDFTFHWESNPSIWIASSKREYAYDSDGYVVLEEFFKWDADLSDWRKSFKSEYSYDAHGNQTINAGYAWDTDLKDWKVSSKFEVSYDAKGNGTLSVYYTWSSSTNDWLGFFRNEDTYDARGNKLSRITSYWNSDSSEWLVTDKQEHLYDIHGNRIVETYFSRDLNQNDWLLTYKKDLTYDSRGNNTLSTFYIWDSGSSVWMEFYKTYYYYDHRYYIESTSICSGDSILWQGEYFNSEGTYDARYISENGSDSIHVLNLTVNPNPPSFSISGHNVVQEDQLVLYSAPVNPYVVYSWSADNGNVISNPSDHSVEVKWGVEGKGLVQGIAEDQNGCMSDTSSFQVSIGSPHNDNSLNTGIKIYPNPAKDQFYVDTREYTQIEVFKLVIINQLGNRLYEALIDSPVYEVNCSSWAVPGLYFIQVLDVSGDVIETQKVILQ